MTPAWPMHDPRLPSTCDKSFLMSSSFIYWSIAQNSMFRTHFIPHSTTHQITFLLCTSSSIYWKRPCEKEGNGIWIIQEATVWLSKTDKQVCRYQGTTFWGNMLKANISLVVIVFGKEKQRRKKTHFLSAIHKHVHAIYIALIKVISFSLKSSQNMTL